MSLVLSLFPGIGLLDMAFEEEGFCVVRGPDLLWGGDIRRFHPPAGRFDGVIGGPPCQRWSRLANIVRAVHGEASLAPDLIPEFRRVVLETRPVWFLMENVPGAPLPETGYDEQSFVANNRWTGADQNRERRFEMRVLAWTTPSDAPYMESVWIERGLRMGWNLYNKKLRPGAVPRGPRKRLPSTTESA